MNKMSFKTMVAAISLVAVAPASLGVLVCNTSVIPLAKTPLNDVITIREVEGTIANDVDTVLAQLGELNPNLDVENVEITSFIKATETASGSAMVSAKPDTDYTGVVGITITPLPKINLNDVITVRKVEGKVANDEGNVLKEIVRLNPRLVIQDIEIINFNKATEIAPGSATIVAKEDTRYSGEVNITITSIPKINLGDVIRIREVEGEVANDEESVLQEIARLNPDLNVENVDIDDFRAASETAPGLAKIIAKPDTKYTGEVDIVINSIPKLSLTDIITINEVDGKVANDPESVLQEIVRLNPNLEISGVEIKNFNKATDITPGSAIIAAKANGKYTGEVGITITQLVNLSFL